MNESEVWEDIGYVKIEKEEEVPQEKLATSMKTNKLENHESEEETAKRRARNLEAIFTVFKEAKMNADGSFETEKYIFWPGTNCYFEKSTQRYECGIIDLCSKNLSSS